MRKRENFVLFYFYLAIPAIVRISRSANLIRTSGVSDLLK